MQLSAKRTGGSRLIRIWIIRIPSLFEFPIFSNSQFIRSPSEIKWRSDVLICTLNLTFACFEGFSLGILFQIEREAPVPEIYRCGVKIGTEPQDKTPDFQVCGSFSHLG